MSGLRKRSNEKVADDADQPPLSPTKDSTNRNKSKQAKAIKSVPFTHHEQLQRLEKPFFIEEIPHLTNLLPEDIRDL